MIVFRMAGVSLQLLVLSFQPAQPNIALQAASSHGTLDSKWNFVLEHTKARHHSPSDSTPNAAILLRLRGACGEPEPPTTAKPSAQARAQRSGASEKQSLRRHVEPGVNSTCSRVRVAKYQSRILFLGQLPYEVTKEQVHFPRSLPHYPFSVRPPIC
jgi:hypothetical protein